MAPSDDLSTILEKIADGKHTDADIAALRQLLRTSDRQITLQLGKYNVNRPLAKVAGEMAKVG
jgi:hypothetical protein